MTDTTGKSVTQLAYELNSIFTVVVYICSEQKEGYAIFRCVVSFQQNQRNFTLKYCQFSFLQILNFRKSTDWESERKENYSSFSTSIHICSYSQREGQHATTWEILFGKSKHTTAWEWKQIQMLGW